jgi:signal transduction histidine kinase
MKVPVWDARGRIRGVAGISTDISELLAAKEELKNSERLAAIGKMITGLAHECRNALQRSQACLSMLMREIRANPKATDYANRVQQAQDHLQHVFEELRSYASPLQLKRSQCNLSSLIHEAWEEIVSVFTDLDVRLRVIESELDLTCDVDAFRIRQVFRNIFENAIVASSAPSSITVEWCHGNLATGPALRTTVRDEGPGFTREQRTQAFKPFYTTNVTGTGLGLTITRRIVESHGGEIEIDGDSNTGGIVNITLPQRRE